MDEQRVQAYLSLIQELLNCPREEVNSILNRQREQIDVGFLQQCGVFAEQLQARGEANQAQFLRDLAQQVGASLGPGESRENQQEALENFWIQLMQAERNSPGNEVQVHQVMRQNIALLTPALENTITLWIQRVLAQHPEQTEDLVGLVENTCNRIEQFPDGRYREVLEIALGGYGAVLELRDDNPQKRVQTLNKLSVARLNQAEIGINEEANIKAAIEASAEAIDILERAIAASTEASEIRHPLGLEKDLSDALTNLGNAHQAQAKRGIDPTANLERALAAYTDAAEIKKRLGLEKDLSSTLNHLGVATQTQAEIGIDPATNLERAIAYYAQAAEIRQRLGLEKNLSRTLNHQGVADLKEAEISIDLATNLERAITTYDEAVAIRRELGLDKDISSTLNNLGNALRTQAEMGIKPAANLEGAIAAYNEAVAIRRELGLDKDLSGTLNHLGNTRRTQAEMGIDPAANLDLAISAYNEAAAILRRLELDKDLSWTLTNLGIARHTQAEMGINPSANLESAISAYNEAAHIRRWLRLDKDLSGTLNNLGIARRTQAEMGINPAANLEVAIAAYDEAAAIQQELGLDKDLSTTLTNLGNARLTQAQAGINPVANLERAIKTYNNAADIRWRLKLKKDHSRTLTNLGNARRTQAEMGIDPVANLERAIAFYKKAKDILQKLQLARDLAQTLNNFGFAYKAQSCLAGNSSSHKQTALENAYRSFQDALEQVEYLRGEIGADSEGYKRNFNEEWNKVYLGMVEVCLELGRYNDAIEYVDRSKARNLSELIATRDAYPGGEIPTEDRHRLQELRQAISEEDRRLKQDPNPDSTHLNQLRQEFQAKYPYKPLKFPDIQSLLDDETVILEWYILNDKFLTFTLTKHSLNLWTSSEEDRKNLVDWGNSYIKDYRHNNNQWRDSLPQRLETLAQILHLDEILQNLQVNFPKCKKLILIPHLFLHLFPLHALPVATVEGEDQLLQDLFSKGVGYAPNCQVLKQAQNRQRPHFNRFFAIQNPTQDLQFTDMEVEAIQSLFNLHQILKHDQAEKAAIDAETLKNAHCVHFSCHGYFNFDDAFKSALILAKSTFTPPPQTDGPSRSVPLNDNKLLDLQKCLTLEDILRLDLTNCRLVTLSACETGITDISSTSDEYIGLPSGFILAGSPNVVSTLWAVVDISTAILMIHFYQTLQQQTDLSVVLALQQTQKWLREATVTDLVDWIDRCPVISQQRQEQMKFTLQWGKTPESQPFSSPYYWAAFCAIGQ